MLYIRVGLENTSLQINNQAFIDHSLIFVQNAEGVQEGKVSSDALKVFLRNIAIMVMVIIPEHRLPKAK